MELTKEQVKSFKEAGYVFIEDLFKLEEIELMNNEAKTIYDIERPEIVKEKNGKAIRTVFGAHTFNNIFSKKLKLFNIRFKYL